MTMCDWCIFKDRCKRPVWHIRAVTDGIMYCPHFKPTLRRNLSMAMVTASFASGSKEVTRRNWAERTRRLFQEGTTTLVWNRQARFGGEPIGVLRLTEPPKVESTADMPDDDYYHEGFHYLDERYYESHEEWPLKPLFMDWRRKDQILTVIRFSIVEIFPGVFNTYATDDEVERCVKALLKAFA